VADEGGDVAGGHAETDSGVNEIREEGDAVFEIVIRDLHDARGELDDGYAGRLFHFAGGIEETVFRHTGVGVDDEDIVANTDVAVSPGAAVFLENFFQAALVCDRFVDLAPINWSVDFLECFFHGVG